MSTSARDWLNWILSSLAAGLTTFGASIAAGAKAGSAVAIVPALVAAVTTAANHLRERPDLTVTVNPTKP